MKQIVSDPVSLALYFEKHDVFVSPEHMSSSDCDIAVSLLETQTTRPLPTDGGNVYELFEGEIPPNLSSFGNDICGVIGVATGLDSNPNEPALKEVLRYCEGASLTKHRDREGWSFTKAILTLCGVATFELETGMIRVEKGDLIILRGRDFIDQPTPVHGTSGNIGRWVFLAEPNYVRKG